jgi:hypothetical protein
MPYTHPTLGVPCLTLSEFWTQEADRDGITVDQAMDNYYSTLAEEQERSRQELLNNKAEALKTLQEYYAADEWEWMPVEIVEMMDATVSLGMSKNKNSFTANVRCSDGKVRMLQYSETHYAGSYWEPPDFDCSCQEV